MTVIRQSDMRRALIDVFFGVTGELLEACGWPKGQRQGQRFDAAIEQLRMSHGLAVVREEHGVRHWRLGKRRTS